MISIQSGWVAVVLALLATGCASVPEPLRGEFAAVSPQQAQAENTTGQRVRWGGEIISTTPRSNQTCIEILGRALENDTGRPAGNDNTQGRFIACAPGFYDPSVYAKGREITVVGTLGEPVSQKIGEYDYRYPHLAVEQLYLWSKRPNYERYPGPPYYGPFYDPFYPFGYGHFRRWPHYW